MFLVCPIWLATFISFIFFNCKTFSLTFHLVSGARIRTRNLSVASLLPKLLYHITFPIIYFQFLLISEFTPTIEPVPAACWKFSLLI